MSEQSANELQLGLDAVFAEDERLIFPYKDRGKQKYADPMKLWARFGKAQAELGLTSNYYDLVREMQNIIAAEPDPWLEARKMEIISSIGDIGRGVFQKGPLGDDGSGWTDLEATGHLNRFLLWQSDLEGKAEASPPGFTPSDGLRAGSAGEAPSDSTSQPGTGSI